MRFHPFRPTPRTSSEPREACPFCRGGGARGRLCNICKRAGLGSGGDA